MIWASFRFTVTKENIEAKSRWNRWKQFSLKHHSNIEYYTKNAKAWETNLYFIFPALLAAKYFYYRFRFKVWPNARKRISTQHNIASKIIADYHPEETHSWLVPWNSSELLLFPLFRRPTRKSARKLCSDPHCAVTVKRCWRWTHAWTFRPFLPIVCEETAEIQTNHSILPSCSSPGGRDSFSSGRLQKRLGKVVSLAANEVSFILIYIYYAGVLQWKKGNLLRKYHFLILSDFLKPFKMLMASRKLSHFNIKI